MHCQEHTIAATRAQQPGELISLDLVGPMQQKSIGGHHYLLMVMDLFSCMHFVCMLPNKSSGALAWFPATFLSSVGIWGAWHAATTCTSMPQDVTAVYSSLFHQHGRLLDLHVLCLRC